MPLCFKTEKRKGLRCRPVAEQESAGAPRCSNKGARRRTPWGRRLPRERCACARSIVSKEPAILCETIPRSQIIDETWARIKAAAALDNQKWGRGDGSRGYAQLTTEFIPIRWVGFLV